MCPFEVPTSENDPRCPGPFPNVEALCVSYADPGLLKFGCMNGKLFASSHNWNFIRSPISHCLASD